VALLSSFHPLITNDSCHNELGGQSNPGPQLIDTGHSFRGQISATPLPRRTLQMSTQPADLTALPSINFVILNLCKS